MSEVTYTEDYIAEEMREKHHNTPLKRFGFDINSSSSPLVGKKPKPTITIKTQARIVVVKKLTDGR